MMRASLVGVAFGVAFAAACHRAERPAKAPPVTALARADVIKVANDTIAAGPEIAGTLEAAQTAQVRARIGGTVTAVGPELGQKVERGALLVKISSGSLDEVVASARSGVAAAERQLADARTEVERDRTLVDAGAIARNDLTLAQTREHAQAAALAQARSALASAATQLADAVVRSPIDGAVSQRAVSKGDVVAPGAALYTIIDPSSIRVSASVPSTAVSAVKLGAEARFTVRGYPDDMFTGTVSRIAPSADPTTKQLAVLIDIPNPGQRLLAGLFTRGYVVAQTASGIVVPSTAIDMTTSSPSVMRVVGGKVERVPVKLGLRDPIHDRVLVSTGLAPGDVILARASAAPPPGSPVTLTTS